ncbi:MFS transporter, partial [Campylobacter jejuni]
LYFNKYLKRILIWKNHFYFILDTLELNLLFFSVYTVFSISWAATGSLSNDLALNTQQATLITSMIVVAKIFGASFTAFLVYKFGLKKGYFLGCILMSSGIFLSFVDSYSGILIIRFLTGLGSACALVCLVPIAQQWFEKKLYIL